MILDVQLIGEAVRATPRSEPCVVEGVPHENCWLPSGNHWKTSSPLGRTRSVARRRPRWAFLPWRVLERSDRDKIGPNRGTRRRSRIHGMTVSASILLGESERIVHEPAIYKLPFAENHKIAHKNPDSSQASPNHGNLICCIRPRLVDVFRDLSRAQATTPHTVDDRVG